jgi:quercetin dioxygenase-like cupin family protein
MTKPILARSVVALLIAAAFAAAPAFAQDKAKPAAAPAAKAEEAKKGDETTKVYVENEKVRVSETTYKAGATSAMRERPPRVVRAMTEGTMERTYADGKKETITYKAGDVKYYPKQTYVQKNAGKSDVVLYVVNIK